MNIDKIVKHYQPVNPSVTDAMVLPNYSGVKSALNNPLVNKDVVYDDMQVQIGAIRAGASSPTWIDYKSSQILSFSNTQNNQIFFNIQFSHRIREGSDTEIHIHTIAPNSNAGNVLWRFTVVYASINGIFGDATSIDILQEVGKSATYANTHIVQTIKRPFTENTGISGFALCSLTRVGTSDEDDYASPIYLLGIDSHYQIDTMGSRQERVK